MTSADGRYSRNEALFGEEGQSRIASTKLVIVGLGGLGAHVAQQLAYLGVRFYALVDFDIVTGSSLNRLVGAVPTDVAARTKKIAVAERMILDINPDATVETMDARIADVDSAEVVGSADVVFGCLDRDIHRLELLELCAELRKPYLDLATDTDAEDDSYGGRVLLCDGNGCPICLDLLDQEQMKLDRMTEGERDVDRRIYGVDRDALAEGGPAVVSINGVVASLAVTEFMAYVTGLRKPNRQLTYRAELGVVRKSLDTGQEGCYFCVRWKQDDE